MASKKKSALYLSVENVGESCYLQDHHNRARECLLYLSFQGGETLAQIRTAIEDELSQADKIPSHSTVSESNMALICAEIFAKIADSEIDLQLLATW